MVDMLGGGTAVNAGGERWGGVDWIKAAAILAVVAQHSGIEFMPMTPFETIVRTHASAFHVPSFFVVSGFLYAGYGPIDGPTLRRRLLRLLVPYLIASLAVHCALTLPPPAPNSVELLPGLFGLTVTAPSAATSAVLRLLTASSLGIYYFVLLMLFFQLLSWPLSRMSPRAIQILLIVAVTYLILWAQEPRVRTSYNFFWEIRNPLHSWHFFLAGWLVRLHWQPLRDFFRRNRAQMVVAALAGVLVYAVAMISPQPPSSRLYRTVYTFAVLGLILAWVGERPVPAFVRFLSESTYAIFLYHRVFQLLVDPYTAEWHDVARFFFLFAVGGAAGAMLSFAGGRLLGPTRSRLLLGT